MVSERRLTVAFDEPADGWLQLELRSNGNLFVDTFSHIYPTLPDLCGALFDVLSGRPARRVVFLLQPAELELNMITVGQAMLRLRVCRFHDHRRMMHEREPVFEFEGETTMTVVTFWRALRRLQTAVTETDFEKRWREPFPKLEMASLTKLLQERGLLRERNRPRE